jgi:hypothetical protein
MYARCLVPDRPTVDYSTLGHHHRKESRPLTRRQVSRTARLQTQPRDPLDHGRPVQEQGTSLSQAIRIEDVRQVAQFSGENLFAFLLPLESIPTYMIYT